MYSKALFLTALLCDLSLAGYNIKMYESAIARAASAIAAMI
jgi:hypothetical protein